MTAQHSGAEAPIDDWFLRPWILGGLGALAGLLIHLIGEEDVAWRMALVSFLFFGSLGIGFTIGPRRLLEPGVFALLAGLVMAGLAFNTVAMDEALAGEEFGFAAGIFAMILALPLFQAGFQRARFATDYGATHFHVWTDAVSAGGAIAFTLLSWIMLVLLNALLELVGIDIIETLLDEEWFGFMWTGGAFGAALGVLRNNLKVIGALQSVVLMVLSLLAVPLAAALLVFVVALLASGGTALWDATDSATPILLSCALGCFILANAIVRDSDEQRSRNRVLQGAALVLAAGILPLALFAAISMGIRIDQYGLAPERIWALLTIVIACAYGLAYWVGLGRGRLAGWSQYLRRANLHLAAATCVVALFLALPILDFGGISARNQVARLEAGKVSAEDFDYAALRWEFGDSGREVLDELAAGEGEVAQLAAAAREQVYRPSVWDRRARTRELAFHVEPYDPELEEQVRAYLRTRPFACNTYCVALDLGVGGDGIRRVALVQQYNWALVDLPATDADCGGEPACEAVAEAERAIASSLRPELNADSQVELRALERHYIYVDGVRMDRAVEDQAEDFANGVPQISVSTTE